MKKQFFYFFMTGILVSGYLSGQVTIPNAGFEQSDKSTTTQTANWKPESDNFYCKADSKQSFKGSYSLKLESKTGGHHFFNQEFPFTSTGLRKYRLKCAIKTKDLDGRLHLGARVFDSNGNTLTKMIFVLTENRNQNWAIAEGFFISEKEASKIRIFGSLFGTGEAWFDEITMDEIPEPGQEPSHEVAMYIHEYFDIIYENSIITDKNFIASLKSKTMYLCGDSTSMNNCRYILQYYTTQKLSDGHSFFTTPEEWKQITKGGKHQVTGASLHNYPSGKMLDNHIAYLTLPMFVSADQKLILKYADTLQTMIASFDKQKPRGWIVDLSNNGGGNCFPMIAGVGPLIGNGVCEYSFSGDGSIRQIIYNNGWTGTAWLGGDSSLVLMKTNPYQLIYPNKPIAIIYSNGTGSSGEVTAIAFMGLPNTKSFGQETYGASTRIDNFELSDGSYLNLVSGVDADRNKNKFGGKIKPDVETPDSQTAIADAIKWILETSE
jgi:hypothetical protein